MNIILLLGSTLGFLAVVIGAYTAHALHLPITHPDFAALSTALRYNEINAALIVTISLFTTANHPIKKYLRYSAWLFILGTLLFSFSIYLAVITGIHSFVRITPLGGIIIMLAWLSLTIVALIDKRSIDYVKK